jgi:hypothetical protein
MSKNMQDMKEKIYQDVINAIKNLKEKDISIENIIEYIDYVNKVRYSEIEITDALLNIAKQCVNKM